MIGNQFERLEQIRKLHDDILEGLKAVFAFAREFRASDRIRPFRVMKIDGQHYSLMEAVLFAQRGVKSFKRLRINNNAPISSSSLDHVLDCSKNLSVALNDILQFVYAMKAEPRNLVVLSGSRLQVQETGEIRCDISDITYRIVSYTDQMMTSVATIGFVVGLSVKAGNDQAAETVHDDVGSIVSSLAEVDNITQEVQALLTKVEAAAARAGDIRATMEAVLAEAKSHTDKELDALSGTVASVNKSATKASNDVAVTTSKREEVDRLAAQAQEAFKDISVFQAGLATTQNRLKNAYEKASNLTMEFENQRDNVTYMIAQAEKMVSGSTVAGLAKAFSDERTELDKSMKGAFNGFIAGIVLLFFTSGALAAYILNIPINGLEWLTTRGSADPTLAQVLSRAVIVIAPFWLTLFSARRYRSLFDLRQQYSHKYNMAFSMDGFKTQAPEFAEKIAAWVFTIVAANPVLPVLGRSMDAPPPMSVQGMMDEMKGMYEKVMGK